MDDVIVLEAGDVPAELLAGLTEDAAARLAVASSWRACAERAERVVRLKRWALGARDREG